MPLLSDRLGVGHGGRQILIVDDEKDITDALKAGLEGKGFVVDAYNDPKKALANVRLTQYDLAIFDIRMPGMNGFELYRQFKELDGQTGVCFFTAFEVYEKEFEKMFPNVRVEAFLKKPMTIAQLATRLNSILERKSDEAKKLRLAQSQ